MKINKIKKMLLLVGLGIGLSGMVNAQPDDSFNRCDSWYDNCFNHGHPASCTMYYYHCY
ncbi:MAG: hypothetical protein ACI8WB_004307 [Phenylobacterium sp.]|jgi:hypothetical protein